VAERAFSYAPELRAAFIAHMADRLNTLICVQTGEMLKKAGAVTPIRCVSAMIYLLKRGPASLADIADTDGQSHQLVSSRVAPLEELGLVTRTDDPNDARRKLLKLTAKGKADAKLLEKLCRDIASALEDLSSEIGVDLVSALETAEKELARRPIAERLATRLRQKAG
jgi:DNA-binding MarR family transcriptional regulator